MWRKFKPSIFFIKLKFKWHYQFHLFLKTFVQFSNYLNHNFLYLSEKKILFLCPLPENSINLKNFSKHTTAVIFHWKSCLLELNKHSSEKKEKKILKYWIRPSLLLTWYPYTYVYIKKYYAHTVEFYPIICLLHFAKSLLAYLIFFVTNEISTISFLCILALLKMGSSKIIYWLFRFSFLMGCIMSKNPKGSWFHLLIKSSVHNLSRFLTW